MLRPSFDNSFTLSFVLAQKYSISAGVSTQSDNINQAFGSNPIYPNIIVIRTENYADMEQYYVTAYLLFQLAKSWSQTVNLLYTYHRNHLTKQSPSFST